MSASEIFLAGVVYIAYIAVPLVIIPRHCFFVGSFRLLFHPLRNYPGPLFGRLTNAYAGYFSIKKSFHIVTYQNFQKYGPVVRQAPNRLVFNTITALHDIYQNPTVLKGRVYMDSQVKTGFPSIFNVIDKTQHRRKRKIMGPALTERSMRAFEPEMQAQIDIFLRVLLDSSRHGSVINMSELCQHLGIDIIGQLSFGYPFGLQTHEKYRFLSRVIDDMSWRVNVYMHFPALGPLEYVLLVLGMWDVLKLSDMVSTMIKTRTQEAIDAHHDLYSMVAEHIGKGEQGLYDGELWPDAMLFIMAGGTTVAVAMSALLFYLSRNPEMYKTLTEEIRGSFGSAQEICAGSKLNDLKYLRACIDEALRMSPPSPTTPLREQDPNSKEPFVVDGHVIPRGTQVGVSLYSLSHNEDYFPDSFAFKPERWLAPAEGSKDDTPERKAALDTMRKAFAPFLLGDRSCIGKSMAYMEMSLAIARCLWFFDFEVAPGKAGELGAGKPGSGDGRHRPGEFQLEDIFVALHRGPNLVFTRRGDAWKELETKG